MANILYLVHRLPYPPNKGDKVRSYHLLKHLAARHRVFLGTFIDDPDDARHVDALRPLCADLHVEPLHPRAARIRSLSGLLHDEALTLPYYRNANLAAWVEGIVRDQRPDAAVVFSSAMAQYVPAELGLRTLVDLVDVDSAKWTQYAGNHRWPLSWLYAREGRKLLEFERATVRRARIRSWSPMRKSSSSSDRRRSVPAGWTPSAMAWTPISSRPITALRRPTTRRKSRSCSPARWTTGRTSTR